MEAAIKGFADTLTSGEGLQPSNAVFRATWEIRNGLNKHGIKLASKESHSPAQLLHVLGQLLDGRFPTSLGGPDPPSDAPSHVRRRGSAASNHRQSAGGAVGREGQLVTAIEVGILRFGSRVKEKFGTERRRGELEANVCNLSPAELKELDAVYDGFRTAFKELKTQLHGLDLNDYRDLWRNHMESEV